MDDDLVGEPITVVGKPAVATDNDKRIIMKTGITSLFIASAAFLAAIAATTAPTRAETEYAWCAFGATQGGSQSCSFSTVEQCRAYVAGAGYCEANPRASAFAAMPGRMQRR